MANYLVAEAEKLIHADVSAVWDALLNPEKIKQYLYGFEAISDWKVGSPITFRGEMDGQVFEDKAIIRFMEPRTKFGYSYWSLYFGTEDKLENYVDFTFFLEPDGENTKLKVTRGNNNTAEECEKQREGCKIFLDNINDVIEKSK